MTFATCARQARNVQRGAIDDLDPHHALGGDASERRLGIVRLARYAPAIDQHVLLGLAEAALVISRFR